MRLCGFTIFVDDVESIAVFYRNLFGVEPEKQNVNSCTFLFGDIKYFIHKKEVREEGMPPNEDHAEFAVDNLDEQINRLKAQGLSFEIEPREYYWGKSAYLRDSEGRFIELVEK